VELAHGVICVLSDNSQQIEEVCLAIEHIICHPVERAEFGERGANDWVHHKTG
jgi:hypothetical protein